MKGGLIENVISKYVLLLLHIGKPADSNDLCPVEKISRKTFDSIIRISKIY